jgi:Protein of unknown function (Hypoth_ymh)
VTPTIWQALSIYGVAGASRECEDAVKRQLQFGDRIKHARILTCSRKHSLLLTNEVGDVIAIKSGFSSGYGGEGPRRFSCSLQLLLCHGAEIDECDVDNAVIEHLDSSALTAQDLERINAAKPIRTSQCYDYVMERRFAAGQDGTLWQEFEPVIPFGIIDARITDLAVHFWENPDEKLMTGYRRLEDTVRERTNLDDHGAKLFLKAFSVSAPRLQWQDCSEGEMTARANLFVGAYGTHRNPRAHRELGSSATEQVSEFLLLNHLFRLEQDSQVVGPKQANK